MDAKYLTSASTPQQLPPPTTPEVVFVGRSNCGKSSLINAICQRQNLARTSQTPGRTQMANFFILNNKVTLVDLPGYGFSATGKSNRVHWQDLATACLQRASVSLVLYLQDARRNLTTEDRDLVRFIGNHAELMVILTKADKAKQAEIQKSLTFIGADLRSSGIRVKGIVPVSAAKSRGIPELQEAILSLAPNSADS
jgi:GTP-binding protein